MIIALLIYLGFWTIPSPPAPKPLTYEDAIDFKYQTAKDMWQVYYDAHDDWGGWMEIEMMLNCVGEYGVLIQENIEKLDRAMDELKGL